MAYDLFCYGLLLIFSLRRWLFLFVAGLKIGQRKEGTGLSCPSLLVLVPFRNERGNLPELVSHLTAIDYPAGQQTIVFIDDGSTDSGRDTIPQRNNWHILTLPTNAGKGAALNLALNRFPAGRLVVVYDADERPQPESLRRLVQPFQDERVGWVTGRRKVSNPLASPIATYATYENLIHQRITLAAKEFLLLAPPSLGSNCAYRRTALGEGFRPGFWLEDSELTIRMAHQGWQGHFASEAISHHAVPQTPIGYWRQHIRWAKGFGQLFPDYAWHHRQLSWPLRLELCLFAAGYVDRLALVGAMVGLVWRGATGRDWEWPLVLLLLVLLTPLLQAIMALQLEKAPAGLWWRLVYLPIFLPLDMAMAVATPFYRRVQWEGREKAG